MASGPNSPSIDIATFGSRLDRAGLTLTDAQKSALFEVYPLFQAMVARATAPLPGKPNRPSFSCRR